MKHWLAGDASARVPGICGTCSAFKGPMDQMHGISYRIQNRYRFRVGTSPTSCISFKTILFACEMHQFILDRDAIASALKDLCGTHSPLKDYTRWNHATESSELI